MSLEIYEQTRCKWRRNNPTLRLKRIGAHPGIDLPWLKHKTLTVVSTSPTFCHDEEVIWISAAWRNYYINFLNPRMKTPKELICPTIGDRFVRYEVVKISWPEKEKA